MKKFILVCALLLAYAVPFAQLAHRLDSAEIIAGTYQDLGNNGRLLTLDYTGAPIVNTSVAASWSQAQELGFTFRFGGKNFTHFYLNTDGYITLDSTSSSNPYIQDTRIAAFNTPLKKVNGYRVYTSGVPGSRICTVQFTGVSDNIYGHSYGFDTINFQIKLYEGSDYIDFVYGRFVPASVAYNGYLYAEISIKASNQGVNVTKTVSAPWSDALFNAYYSSFYHNRTVPPVIGTIYRFKPRYRDVAIKNLYLPGKQPIPAGATTSVQVRLKNNSSLPVLDYTVGYSNFGQSIALSPFADTVVNLPFYPATELGYRTLAVSSYFDDDTLTNNSLSASQEITTNLFSHADTAAPSGAFSHNGLVLARYSMNGTAAINKVVVRIDSGTPGTAMHAVVLNAGGSIVGQSAVRQLAAGDIGTSLTFSIDVPPSFTDTDFYVGLSQSGDVAVAAQAEYPVRPNAFYTAAGSGANLAELTTAGKLMIQAELLMNLNNDISVVDIIALKKVAVRYVGVGVTARALIKNNSTEVISSLPVKFQVQGTDITSTILTGTIQPGDTSVVYFKPYDISQEGVKELVVTIPGDADVSNNRFSFTQLFTNNSIGYTDSADTYEAFGFGTGTGTAYAGFRLTSGLFMPQLFAFVKQVKVRISGDSASIGKKVRAVIKQEYTTYAYSDPCIIRAADLNQDVTFTINDPFKIPGIDMDGNHLDEFAVGLQQIGDGINAFSPIAFKPGSSFSSGAYGYPDGYDDGYEIGGIVYGDFLIEAILSPSTPFTATTPAGSLANWSFQPGNSPAQSAATVYSNLLVSPNVISRGSGAPAGSNFFQTAGFGNDGISVNNTDYFEVKLSPAPGQVLTLQSILFNATGDSAFAAGEGVLSQFAYSLNGVDFTLIGSPSRSVAEVLPAKGYVNIADIKALQQILPGTTVTLRYYASGQTTNGSWGFGSDGLSVVGYVGSNGLFWVEPLLPELSSYVFNDCTNSIQAAVRFKVYGAVTPGTVYTANLQYLNSNPNRPGQEVRYWYEHFADIGSLATDSCEGIIRCEIPVYYLGSVIGVRRSPYYSESQTASFALYNYNQCTFPRNAVRSVQSGKWTDNSTWESNWGGKWIPATHWPAWKPQNVRISSKDTVVVDQRVNFESINVYGHLKVVNDSVNKGQLLVIPYYEDERSFGLPRSRIETDGSLQVVSKYAPFDSVILMANNGLSVDIRPKGKITIGDGSSDNGPGFEKFAQALNGDRYIFRDSSVFEWNSTSPNGLKMNGSCFTPPGAFYMVNIYEGIDAPVTHPILRLTKLAAGNLGSGADSLLVFGFVDLNTPVTFGGTGRKLFRDGILGNAVITQPAGAGKIVVHSGTTTYPVSEHGGSRTGLLDGNLRFELNGDGLMLDSGVTITGNSLIHLDGNAFSNGNFTLEPTARLNLDSSASLQINNGNLNNDGTLDGTGRILFTGINSSTIRSTGMLQSSLELNTKQLSLAGNIHTTGQIKLGGNSRLLLGAYNLQMDTAALIANSTNYIVTNDTGKLTRTAVSDSLLFPVGANNLNYTPLMLGSFSDAGKSFSVRVKAGVLSGGLTGLTIDSAHVNCSWVVQKIDTGSSEASLRLQWPARAVQAGFDRNLAYISQLQDCGALPDCNGVYYDEDRRQQAAGNDPFFLTRSNISPFNNNNGPAIFVVKSGPVIFRFTGNGEWANPANWIHGIVPPLDIPRGVEVIISPATGGSCIVNGNVTVLLGGKLTLTPGSSMEVRH